MEENQKITINPENSIFTGHVLVIIPIDPKFSPNNHQITECLNFLSKEYPKCIIESEKLDNVEFEDCGQNFESVNCNLCGQEIDLEFWQKQMSNSYGNTNFNNLEFVTDCCKKRTNLNELKYNGDCGFSSFNVTINNVESNDDLEAQINKRIDKIFETEVKVFWRHI